MEVSHIDIAMCSIHADIVAIAVSFNTKELLCFQCCMEKAKSSEDSNVKQIETLIEESEKLLLQYILAKQQADKKGNLMKEYEGKAKSIKDDMNGQVQDLYNRLLEKLDKMRENTFSLIETKYGQFLNTFCRDKKEVESVRNTIDEQLDKFSVATLSDVDNFKTELEEVKNKLIKINDYELYPEGTFQVNKDLTKAINEWENSFGEINIEGSVYETTTSIQRKDDEEKVDFDVASDGEKPKIHPKPSIIVNGSTDDLTEPPKVTPRKKATGDKRSASEVIQLSKRPVSKAKESPKDEKNRKWFFFGKDKKPTKLEEYEDVVLLKDTLPQTKNMINTTRHISGLPTQLRAPFKFSKMITVGPRTVVLLSKEHSSIFVSGLDFEIHDSKTYAKDQLISIVGMTDEQIAVLKNNETEIEIIQVINGKFAAINTIKLTQDTSEFTGFDYSSTKSQFAIGTESQYFLIDNKGKNVKVRTMEPTNEPSEVKTIFDFENSNIFIINKTAKSMKCVALKGGSTVWKSKCDDPLFQPESVNLHQRELFIVSPCLITIFATKDGKFQRDRITDHLMKDCLGLCVIDNEVLVLSSNSDDFEGSKKLGFVAL